MYRRCDESCRAPLLQTRRAPQWRRCLRDSGTSRDPNHAYRMGHVPNVTSVRRQAGPDLESGGRYVRAGDVRGVVCARRGGMNRARGGCEPRHLPLGFTRGLAWTGARAGDGGVARAQPRAPRDAAAASPALLPPGPRGPRPPPLGQRHSGAALPGPARALAACGAQPALHLDDVPQRNRGRRPHRLPSG